MEFTFEDFLNWERASRDIIDVKRAYIDMAGGLEAGVMLSQIIWHYCCARHDRLRVVKENHVWLRIEREDWWKECRVTDRQADRLLSVLKGRGLIATKKFRYEGAPRSHVRVEEAGFLLAWQEVTAKGYVSRPPSPLVVDRTDLTDSLFTGDVQDAPGSDVQDAEISPHSGGNGSVQDAEKAVQDGPDFPKRGNQNSPNGEYDFPKRGNQNSPNGEIYPIKRESQRDNNNREASDDAEKRAADAARVVVVSLLTQNKVHADQAQELAEAGLTEAQARQEIGALDGRQIDRNRGGMLYKACRARLKGQAWESASAQKPRRKLYPAAPAEEKPPTEPTPIPEEVKAQFDTLRKKCKPGGVSGLVRPDHEQRGQEQRDAEEARKEFLREQVRQLEAQEARERKP